MNQENRTLIKKHTSYMIKSLVESINSITDMHHRSVKGQLRELFVSSILKSFLPSQLEIGTGIIINKDGEQSNQTDIIIYDTQILPPFIKEAGIGVYPAESVVATIEVKSWLKQKDIRDAEKAAARLLNEIYAPKSTFFPKVRQAIPLCAIIGFIGKESKTLTNEEEGKNWLNKEIVNLSAICHVGEYSWLKTRKKRKKREWSLKIGDKLTYEETKRFIAVLSDNARFISRLKSKLFEQYYDWISIYVRDQ